MPAHKKSVSTLERLDEKLDPYLAFLGLVWLALLVWDLVHGLSPLLHAIGYGIWALFVIDFGLEVLTANDRVRYLKRNWLTAISLLLPAFGVFRIFRVLRLLRGVRLLRVLTTLNRSTRALAKSLGRRGFIYVVLLSFAVLLGGSAGMYAFEKDANSGFASYGQAVWWTAMILTTMGSADWPTTPEGRILCVILALYAFAVFGYVTATLATYFVGDDKKRDERNDARQLRREIAALREELARQRQGG